MRAIGILAVLVLWSCGTDRTEEPPELSQSDAAGRVSDVALSARMVRIRTAAARYRAVHGTLPTEAGQLVESGFLHSGQELDPWGNPFALNVSGARLTIVSYGADGKPGGTEENRDRLSEP